MVNDDSFFSSPPPTRVSLAWAMERPIWSLSVRRKASRRESAMASSSPVALSTEDFEDAWAWRAASVSPVISPLRALLDDWYWARWATSRLPLWSWTLSWAMGYSECTYNG